jgi:Protein of unknown function (DUF3263)
VHKGPAIARDEPVVAGAGSTLSALDEGILAFERRRWRSPSAKDEAIRTTFGIAPAAYYVALSALVESDEAMAYDPLLVQRLQRRVRAG